MKIVVDIEDKRDKIFTGYYRRGGRFIRGNKNKNKK